MYLGKGKLYGTLQLDGRRDHHSIVFAKSLKKFVKIDETTENWIVACEGEIIFLPHQSTPDKLFLEYHNDVVFRGQRYSFLLVKNIL